MIILIYLTIIKILLKHDPFNIIIISKITWTGEFSSNTDTPSQHISSPATTIVGFFICTLLLELRVLEFDCIETSDNASRKKELD